MKRARSQRGSMAVELVILVPVIATFALMALGLGRYESARQEVADAARAGAQAASIAISAAAAPTAATQAALVDIENQQHMCADPGVTTDTADFVAGGVVRVSVSCHVDMSDLAIPGIPGALTIEETQVATVDPYRSVQ